MLRALRIRNLALIETLELELGAGLTVVTGETGAGKSMLIDALELVLGAKARAQVVRRGAQQAEVEAAFDVPERGPVRDALAELSLLDDDCDELLLRRVVTVAGRSRAFINGRQVPTGQLRTIATRLVDIASQHEHHMLAAADAQRRYLDGFAGHTKTLATYEAAFRTWKQLERRCLALETSRDERVRQLDYLRFQVDEIDSVLAESADPDGLHGEVQRLRHGERLAQELSAAERALTSDEGAVVDTLARVMHTLEALRELDPALDEPLSVLRDAHAAIDDAARTLQHQADRDVADEATREALEAQLDRYVRLRHKYGANVEEIRDFCAKARAEIAALEEADDELDSLRETLAARRQAAEAGAEALSESRRKAAARLSKQITKAVRELGMAEASVHVDVSPRLDADGRRTLGPQGQDAVSFGIAPNKGESMQALGTIASGGELSRVLLAIKCALSSAAPRALYVFDEIDTGVGGAIGEIIGMRLRELSERQQVICITHLAQIAACGDAHLHVSKGLKRARTVARAAALTAEARQQELARMLGGVELTDATSALAGELLAKRRAPRKAA